MTIVERPSIFLVRTDVVRIPHRGDIRSRRHSIAKGENVGTSRVFPGMGARAIKLGRETKCAHPMSPGRDGPSVAGGAGKRNPRTYGIRELRASGRRRHPFHSLRRPPTAWPVCGFVGARGERSFPLAAGLMAHFHPAFRCAAYGATLWTPLRAYASS
jgi:hypothetical protein